MEPIYMRWSKMSRYLIAITSLIGLFTSIYLFYEYVTGGKIACALVSGCDIVRASVWAWPFGLPLPLFGALFYLAVFGWLVIRSILSHPPRWFMILGRINMVLGFLISVFLTFVEWLDLQNFCFWCLVSAACATFIFILMFFDREAQQQDSGKVQELRYYFIALITFLILGTPAFIWLTGLTQVH